MTRGGCCSHWLDFGEEQEGADCLKSAFVPTTRCQGPAPLTNHPVSPQSWQSTVSSPNFLGQDLLRSNVTRSPRSHRKELPQSSLCGQAPMVLQSDKEIAQKFEFWSLILWEHFSGGVETTKEFSVHLEPLLVLKEILLRGVLDHRGSWMH